MIIIPLYKHYCSNILQFAENIIISYLQINLPDSVTERCAHSLSTYMMGPHCVWLVIVGGAVEILGPYVNDPNVTMVVELGK